MSDEKQAIAQNISLLISQNRSAEARVELDRLLALDPEDPESRSLAGDVYAWTGADGAAYKQYNLAADSFNRLGRPDKALGVHHKILDLDTSMMDAGTQGRIRLLTLLVGAEDALVAGHHDKAVAGYQEAIRQFPNHTITYQRLATLLVRMGRHADAVEQYLTVGRAFYGHGVLPKARPYFERVLELQADQSEALEAVLTCLKSEDKEADGVRFLKAAVQQALARGRNEEAAAWFERLPEPSRDGATPLGAALLLQSEEVGQAERMVAQLDLSRSEVTDWFKTMGRAALDRGDSLSADVYFRWGSGQLETASAATATDSPVVRTAVLSPAEPIETPEPAVAVTAAQEPVAAQPVEVSAPTLAALPPTPPPGLAPPLPPPGLALPQPPPGLGVPAPPPMPSTDSPDDRTILQTMGEMCLAEEMFEEAKQVFDRLAKAEPDRPQIWDLLNRARAGLGLHAVSPAVLAPPAPVLVAPVLPPPAPVVVVPEPVAEAEPVVVPAPVAVEPEPAAVPEPVVIQAPAPLAPPVLAPPALIPPPLVVAPPALPPLPTLIPPPLPVMPLPLPLFAAAEAALSPEASSAGAGQAPSYSEAEEGRPQLEEMGRRTHTPSKAESHIAHPAVEWDAAPYAVGPAGDAVTHQPSHAVVPEPAATEAKPPLSDVRVGAGSPRPAPIPEAIATPVPVAVPASVAEPRARRWAPEPEVVLAPVAAGQSKILHTAFTVQLGELPPALSSPIDNEDEIIE